MAEQTAVEFIEEWQTGAFLVFACAFGGVAAGLLVGSVTSPVFGLIAAGAAVVLVFVAISYFLYGRERTPA